MTLSVTIANRTATPHRFLKESFGKLAYNQFDKPDGGHEYACAVADIYEIKIPALQVLNYLRGKFGQRALLGLYPVQGVGDTKEDSAMSLYSQLTDAAKNETLYKFEPQRGQPRTPFLVGKSYECVVHDDPMHSHNNPALANFAGIVFNPRLGFGKSSVSNDGLHLHILLK